VPVTAENRLIYIVKRANYVLNIRTKEQTNAFIRGLLKVIPKDSLSYFYPHEIQLLLTGGMNEIDINDLR
jgi:hypothetical protein